MNNIKVGTCVTSLMKNGVNKMHPIMFSQQLGWFVGKGIDLCACGPRMKPHNSQSGGQWWNVDQIFSNWAT